MSTREDAIEEMRQIEIQAYRRLKLYIATSVVGLLFLVTLVLSFYTVDQGERAVITRNGRIIKVSQPGMNFKLPWFDRAHKISIQTQAKVYTKVLAYSRDQQVADFSISVNYKILPDKVSDVYAKFGTEENLIARILDRRVFEESKNVFGKFNAIGAIQDRASLVMQVEEAVKDSAIKAGDYFQVESVQIENIDFSDAYEQAVEDRMKAEVEVERIRQNLEQEKLNAQIKVTKARADAQEIRLRGQAEAEAINQKGKALHDNPSLIALEAAQKWDGVLPQTMVPGAAVPFVEVK